MSELSPGAQREVVSLARQVAREMIQAQGRGEGGLVSGVPLFRWGLALVDGHAGDEVTVRLDGDADAIHAVNATGRYLAASSRALVTVFPSGLAAVTGGGFDPHEASLTQIAGEVLQANAGSIVVPVPQSFNSLRIVGQFRNSSANNDEVWLRLNGDSGTNYYYQYLTHDSVFGAGSGAAALTGWRLAGAPGTGSAAGNHGVVEATLHHYQYAGSREPVLSWKRHHASSTSNVMMTAAGTYFGAAVPVTQLSFHPLTVAGGGSGSILAGSSWAVYGVGRRLGSTVSP